VHAVQAGKVHTPLTLRQGQTDLPDLSILNLRTGVPVSPQTSTVPQTVNHVAGRITEVKVVWPVVRLVIVAVADELVATELRAQDHAHHRAVQLNHANSRLTR
jgi:hypothetical protein